VLPSRARLEKGADRDLTQFNTGNCKVPRLGRNSPEHQHRLGATQLESNPAEKALRVLVDTTSQRPTCRCGAGCEWCPGLRWVCCEVVLPLCSAPERLLWGALSRSGDRRDLGVLERAQQRGTGVARGLPRGKAERAGTAQPAAGSGGVTAGQRRLPAHGTKPFHGNGLYRVRARAPGPRCHAVVLRARLAAPGASAPSLGGAARPALLGSPHSGANRSLGHSRRRWRGPLGITRSDPLPKQGHPEQAAQHRVQAGFAYPQRRRLHSPSGQPVPGLRHPQREEVLPHVQTELPVLQFVPVAPCPVAGHH